MYKIQETKEFRRKLLKMEGKLFNKVFLILERLEKWPPFEKSFNVHKLNWKYNEYYSINLTGDYRIIFNIDNKESFIYLLDIWTHSQLYK